MSAFNLGDKVIVEGVVRAVDPGSTLDVRIETAGWDNGVWVPSEAMKLAPEPPYVEPELVPGMVVAPEGETDPREWFVCGGLSPDGRLPIGFRDVSDWRFARADLPARIRVVRDPREVAS